MGLSIRDVVQRPAGTHGQRHQPVFQPGQQPGGVVVYGQLGPGVGHPELPRRDASRRLIQRTGGTLHWKHQQRVERPVYGLQPAAGDRNGTRESRTVATAVWFGVYV